jgi:hypothetical protein
LSETGDLREGFYSLEAEDNKVKTENEEQREGLEDKVPELSLEMSNEALLDLEKKWIKKWSAYYPKIKSLQEKNEKYWLGKFYDLKKMEDGNSIMDNIIFESLETFLPIAGKNSPDPVVTADNSEEGNSLSKKVQQMLVYLADNLRMKLRIKRVIRYWALYLLGVVKVGWSLKNNEITLTVIRPQKLILDSDGTVNDDMEYDGEFVGEYKEEKASILVQRFPESKEMISEKVEGNMGTKIKYKEWTTDEYTFWTYNKKVLGKIKNPHWNYPQESTEIDENGNEVPVTIPAKNHFNTPKKPYVFLSIFNLGKHPFDETSLIGQNLSNQDIINKRNRQIDRNVDMMNGSIAISGEKTGLTKEQASQAVDGFRKGKGIFMPSGDPNQGVLRVTSPNLPSDVYNNLIDVRNELRNIFGTRGSSPQGIINERSVRGKLTIAQSDQSRIGGGIVEYVEQFSDKVFNWFVQMMYVYYDESHIGAVIGRDKAQEYVALSNQDFTRKLTVSVKEGSLIPKDSVSKAEQAIQLAQLQMIDPITLFDRLEFPNPRETAKRLWIWNNNPTYLFSGDQDIAAIQQAQKEQEDEQELKAASYKDQEHVDEVDLAVKKEQARAIYNPKPKSNETKKTNTSNA